MDSWADGQMGKEIGGWLAYLDVLRDEWTDVVTFGTPLRCLLRGVSIERGVH